MQKKRTGEQCVSVTLPELLQLASDARQFSLSAMRILDTLAGKHLSRLLSRGMEYAESRRYQNGDDIRNLDWRLTARTGKAHTKLFSAEKERQVFLWGDMRPSMFFATQGVFKSVQAALLMGYLAWNAVSAGNRIGGLLFDDRQLFEFRPALGKRGVLPFLQCLAESARFEARCGNKPSNEGMLDQALTNIERLATPGGFIFIVSDFRNLSARAQELLIQAARHSDICLCFIYDRLEEVLPGNGLYPVTDGNEEFQLNTCQKECLEGYKQLFAERKNAVKTLGSHHHIHYLECSTEDDCLAVLKKKMTR